MNYRTLHVKEPSGLKRNPWYNSPHSASNWSPTPPNFARTHYFWRGSELTNHNAGSRAPPLVGPTARPCRSCEPSHDATTWRQCRRCHLELAYCSLAGKLDLLPRWPPKITKIFLAVAILNFLTCGTLKGIMGEVYLFQATVSTTFVTHSL